MMWASSPTDKPLIFTPKFRIDQIVAFATGGGTPPLQLRSFQPFVCASIYRLHRVLIDGRPMVAPTVKLSICAVEFSFYQTVTFASSKPISFFN